MMGIRTEGSTATPTFLSELLETLTQRGRAILRGSSRPAASPINMEEIANALLSRRGEASGVALAAALLSGYRDASSEERLAFFLALRDGFGPNIEATSQALAVFQERQSQSTISALHMASEPRRQELFRRLNLAPGGTEALVSLRADLLSLLNRHPDLAVVDADLMHLLSSWFNRGFLSMRPIDWSTPASILEKIIRYEAVHAIDGWEDLRNRLKPMDRRCYGFFHPQLIDEPIIFVEVALTTTVPGSIDELLDTRRTPICPRDAEFAVFYSISNTQAGLKGVNFGNFLIKQVVENLKAEFPHLKGFLTLSPAPSFAEWLATERAGLPAGEQAVLQRLDEPDWADDPAARESIRPVLMRAASRYFTLAKDGKGKPLDPVSRFHLGNGARLDRICPAADMSPKGLKQSHGLMVNYRYNLSEIEKNHEAFAEQGVVTVSPDIAALAATNMSAKSEVRK